MIQVYCDGACSGNPGPGGWAFVIPSLGIKKSGYQNATTNNRMELTAVIEALSYLSSTTDQSYNDVEVEIITDSQYVVKSMTENWRKLKNTDLWSTLTSLCSLGWKITWTWVKGHANNTYNTRCDELAVEAYTKKMAAGEHKTVYERLKELSVEELAKWLAKNLPGLSATFADKEDKLLGWLNGVN